MKEIKNKTLYGLHDRGDKLVLSDMQFKSCTFINCLLSLTTNIKRISRIDNVELLDCVEEGCDIGPAILSNVSVKNLTTSDLFIIWGALFDRVTFSGNMGRVKINFVVHPSDRTKKMQKPFDNFRKKFYKSVDFALDISEARFKDFDMRGIPAHLIKRDPESQIVIKREKALEIAKPGWEKLLESTETHWPFVVNLFLSDGDADRVLVAPLGAPKAQRDRLLKGLNELRTIGLAEPD